MHLNTFILVIPAVLIAITVHEFSHGYVAVRMGDPTPRFEGRLSLNPLRHLDPIGFLMLVLFRFGWAKPVHVNPRYFPDPRRGMMFVALAGPGANFVTAYICQLLLKLLFPSVLGLFLLLVRDINLFLGVFNLIPVPPLDGSKILAGLLPRSAAGWMAQLESSGPLLLIILIVSGAAQQFIRPVYRLLLDLIQTLS